MAALIHQSIVTDSMHLQPTYTPHLQYLQSEEHLKSSQTSTAEIVNVLRPLAIFAEELHRVFLTACLTGL